MSEEEHSVFPKDINNRIGLAIGERMLASNDYADLKTEDIIKAGLIGSGESFPEGMSKLLGMDKRIAGVSWEALCQRIPPPTDSKTTDNIIPNMLVDEEDEQAVRLRVLDTKNDSPGLNVKKDAYEASRFDLQTLSLEVLNAAKSESNLKALPKSLEREVTDPKEVLDKHPLEAFMQTEPTIVNVPEVGYCFALPIPKENGSELSVFIPPSLDDYLVVLDPDLNSQLADLIFERPSVLRYFLLDQIESTQSEIVNSVESKFRDAALEKYPELVKTLDNVVAPLGKHIYKLLESDVEKKGKVYITEVFRDRYDADTLLGKEQPNTDRAGSESGAQNVTVSKNKTGGLLFEWPSSSMEWEIDDLVDPPLRKLVNIPEINGAIVNLSADGKLVFSDTTPPEPSMSFEDYFSKTNKPMRLDKDSEHLQEMFRVMTNVFSLKELKERGKAGIDDGRRLVDRLTKTGSLHELFSELRDTRLYPHLEFFYSFDPNLYVVGAFFDKKESRAKMN